jgi:succinate dehydrogenase / fumarate reductase flavoprotein subunit
MALDVSELQTITHDVLVVGAGGAGLRAAIECAALGLDTGVVTKSLLGKAHTVMAEGGCAAALGHADDRDNWKIHFRDTMRGGKFLNQWRMAELHAKQAPDRVRELEEWGAVFDRTKEGWINQRNFGGHRFPRLAHTGDRTGLELIRALQDKVVHCDVTVHAECNALDVLKDGDRVSGVVGLWRDTGRFVVIRAKALIFATGGGGKAWRITSNSWEYTGDGQRMAYDAGAQLMDMEFTQFHPTGMVWPPSVRGILVTEGVRGEGGLLTNSEGKRFMFDYIPDRFKEETADTIEEASRWIAGDNTARRPPELLTRDVVARAILAEVEAGRGSPHGGAFLNIAASRDAAYIKKKLPSMYHQFKELAEVDITAGPMEVGPTLHYFMGGIRVDPDSQMTQVPGLFACGECAAGLHGAALDEEQVMSVIRAATEPLNRESGENPYVVHDALRDIMHTGVGIWRTDERLEHGIEALEGIKDRVANVKAEGSAQYNPSWSEALDLRGLLLVGEVIARAARVRQESRGAHSRADFEGEREEWGAVNLVVFKGEDGSMQIEKVPREAPAQELTDIARSVGDSVKAMQGPIHG